MKQMLTFLSLLLSLNLFAIDSQEALDRSYKMLEQPISIGESTEIGLPKFVASDRLNAAGDPKVLMLIDGPLYPSIAEGITNYINGVESTLPFDIIEFHNQEWRTQTFAETRAFIKSQWESQDIKGVILVGFFPYMHYNLPGQVRYIADGSRDDGMIGMIGYEDLDGEFLDLGAWTKNVTGVYEFISGPANGVYDHHVWKTDGTPYDYNTDNTIDIWCALMRPFQAAEGSYEYTPAVVDQMNDFFEKLDKYYSAEMVVPQRGLAYCNKDWGNVTASLASTLENHYGAENTDSAGGSGVYNSAQDYMHYLGRGYEMCNLWSHSAGWFHDFDRYPWRGVQNYELLNRNGRGSMITWGFNCHGSDFAEAQTTGSMGQNYVLSGIGQVYISSAMSYGVSYADRQMTWMTEGEYIGEAFRRGVEDEYKGNSGFRALTNMTIVCQTFNGNPLLYASDANRITAAPATASGTINSANQDLEFKLIKDKKLYSYEKATSNGIFTFSFLEEGDYLVKVYTAGGYLIGAFNFDINRGESKNLGSIDVGVAATNDNNWHYSVTNTMPAGWEIASTDMSAYSSGPAPFGYQSDKGTFIALNSRIFMRKVFDISTTSETRDIRLTVRSYQKTDQGVGATVNGNNISFETVGTSPDYWLLSADISSYLNASDNVVVVWGDNYLDASAPEYLTESQPLPEYELEVNTGNGSGVYEAGEKVNITANSAASGQIFDKWMGDVEALDNAYSDNAVVTMPYANVVLIASYKTIPVSSAVYEYFGYATDSDPTGQTGGANWINAWEMTSGSAGWASAREALVYTDSNMNNLWTAGNNIALHPLGDGSAKMRRKFSAYSSGEFYFSFLVKPVTPHGGYDYMISFGNDSDENAVSMIARGWGDQYWLINGVRPAAVPIPAVGATQLIAGKVNLSNNTVEFWSNPDLLNPGSADHTTTYSSSLGSISQVLLYQQANSSIAGNVINSFDEIRVGTSWQDIVPTETTQYSLTIENGSGSGIYTDGANITITADTSPTGQLFDKWTGDTSYLTDANSSSTSVTMPAESIRISASYKNDAPHSESFDYVIGSDPTGQNGGSNWDTAWEMISGSAGGASVREALSYTDSNMNTLWTAGNNIALHPQGDAASKMRRKFGAYISGEFYFSFLVKPITHHSGYDYAIMLGNDSTESIISMIARGWGDQYWLINGTRPAAIPIPAVGTTQLVVGKVDLDTDTVELWSNPDLTNPGTAGFTTTYGSSLGSVSQLVLYQQSNSTLNGRVTNSFDEIRIGKTWQDVTPMEAATYSLTVANGSGDGSYEAGEFISITADSAPAGQVFNQWTGDISYLADANSASTIVTMPSSDVNLTATYMAPANLYEGFDYTLGSDPTGQTGGLNWSAAWEMLSGAAGGVNVREPLTYTDGSGNSLLTVGNNIALHPQGDAASKMKRTFNAYTGGEFYFSFLVKPVTHHSGYDYNISLGNDSNENAVSMIARGWGDQYWLVNGTRPAAIPIPAVGTTQLLVGKVNLATDTVELWSNPDLTNPGTAGFTTTYGSSLGSISQVVLYQQSNSSLNGRVTNSFDEIRLGNTWSEVTPQSGVTTYTLTINQGSGSGTYTQGTSVNINANSAPAGQEFDQWTGDTSNVADVNSASTTINMPAANTSITATYKDLTYSLTVSQGSGSGTYTQGTSVNISANTAPTGQEFDQWTGDTSNVADVNSASTIINMPAANTSITATYKALTYSLTVSQGSGSGTYTQGTAVNITANTAPTGQVFDKWTGDTSNVSDLNSASATVTMPSSNVSLSATYKDITITYTLTVNQGSGSGTYAQGTTVNITANTAPTGQMFDKWTGDTSSVVDINSSSTTVIMPSATVTLTATYKALIYTAINIIPQPQEVIYNGGTMPINNSTKIIYADTKLENIANVLATNIQRVYGLTLAVEQGTSAPNGSLLLKYSIDPNLRANGYKLTVGDSALVEGQNNLGVSYGCVSFLQAIANNQIEKINIVDGPDTEFSSVMIDIARQWHEISEIKQVIDLCQMYKMPYLHLHLSDNDSFTFSSTHYPELQGPGTRYYTLAEWKDMVSYAGHRGVVLIPEMDVPGHASRMCQAMPDLFGRLSQNTIDFGNPSVWVGVSNLITEFCEVFTNSPYIHLGGDEVWAGDPVFDVTDPTNAATIANYDLDDMTGVFNFFFNTMNDVVKSHNKSLILWEGFGNSHSKCSVDTDISVMMFDNYKNAQTYYIDSGYKVINTSWFPLYVLNWSAPLESIYAWDLYTFGNYVGFPRRYTSVTQYQVTSQNMVSGAGMCSWEQPGEVEVPSLRRPMATMSERIWNRGSTATFTDFTNRLENTDAKVQAMMATGVPSQVVPSASFNIYEDKIVVRWLPADGFPTKYTLLRNTSDDPNTATEILVDTTLNAYNDTSANLGQTYYYWVKAGNFYGYASPGSSADGQRGNTVNLPYAYENFDYNVGEGISAKNGGIGFGTSWTSDEGSATSSIKDDNLTYPGLVTGGKCIHFEANGGTDPQRSYFQRDTLENQGIEGSDLWTSCLIRPTNVGDGDFRYYVGVGSGVPVCKRWGNGLYVPGGNYVPIQLENDQTYFIVVKYECGNGSGRAYLWVNPVAGASAPSLKDPSASYSVGETFLVGKTIGFTMQYHGNNAYDLDEMRVGSSWAEVCPLSDPPVSTENQVYDGFTGTAGATVIGSTNGLNWSGSWYDGLSGLHNADAIFATTGLEYLDSQGIKLQSEGQALEFNPQVMGDPSYMRLERSLNRAYGPDNSDSQVFFSFLVKPVIENISLDYDFRLGNDLSLVVRGWRSTWEIDGNVSAIAKPSQGSTQFIVGKLDYSSGLNYEIWMNPDLSNPGTADFSGSKTAFSFDKVSFAQQTPAGFSSQINHFDEVRVGTSWQDVTPIEVVKYDLVVVNGSGDGNYEPGESINVIADTAPAGQVFGEWTGDTSYLADANSASTTVTMPASDISLTATYTAPAALYEGFDYTSGSNPNGQTGGLSWSTAWEMTSGSAGWANVFEPLNYTDGSGNSLLTVGNNIALHPQGDAAVKMKRTFNAYNSGEFYFSFLAKPVTHHSGYDYSLALGNDSNENAISMIARGWGDQYWLINGTRPAAIPIPAVGTTQLIVGKVNLTTDTVELWSNPDLTNPGTAGFTTTYSSSLGSISQVVLYQQSNSSLNGRVTNSFDEIRIGNTWAEVTPQSTAVTYSLTVNQGSGSGTYVSGTSVSISANSAPAGQEFDQWTGDTSNVANVNSASTTMTMPAANTSITATYKDLTYTLTVNQGSGSGTYTQGTAVNISANTAPSGQVFDKWTGDTSNVANINSASTTITMPAASTSITATYKDITYTLTVNQGSGSGTYTQGTAVNISANTAPTGQVFDKWTGDTSNVSDVNAASTTVTMPSAAVTITATYKSAIVSPYEGFNYVVGSDPTGQTGGYNWTTAWEMISGSAGWASVREPLTYTDASGNSLLVEGNNIALHPQGDGHCKMRRKFSAYTSGEFYFSFLVKPITYHTGYDYAIYLGNDSTDYAVTMVARGWGDQYWLVNGTRPAAIPIPAVGTTQLIVGKVNLSNNTVDLWSNPDLTNPGTAGFTTTYSSSLGSISQLVLYQQSNSSLNGRVTNSFDEVRFGDTWAEVTPQSTASSIQETSDLVVEQYQQKYKKDSDNNVSSSIKLKLHVPNYEGNLNFLENTEILDEMIVILAENKIAEFDFESKFKVSKNGQKAILKLPKGRLQIRNKDGLQVQLKLNKLIGQAMPFNGAESFEKGQTMRTFILRFETRDKVFKAQEESNCNYKLKGNKAEINYKLSRKK